jgi:DNA-binding NarL/FixJ family response regulator
MSTQIRVLLADPEQLVRLGLRMLLEQCGDIVVVGEGSDIGTTFRAARDLRPDVVIADVRLGGECDGVELAEALRNATPDTGVLILSAFDCDEFAFAALRAGARGFLLKNSGERELLAAVRRVAGGDAMVEPRVTARLLQLFGERLPSCDEIVGSSRPIDALIRDPRLAELTDREYEIFVLVANGHNNLEIVQRLHLSESTVKTHIGRILMKLQMRDRVHLVMLGYETGIVHSESTAPSEFRVLIGA